MTRGKNFSDKERATIRALRRQGMLIKQIAAAIGRPSVGAISRVLNAGGTGRGSPSSSVPPHPTVGGGLIAPALKARLMAGR